MHNRDQFIIRPCTWVWLIMMGLTLVTWFIGHTGQEGLNVSLLVLGLALLKGQLLGDYFMGLKPLQSFWRWPVTLWLLLPGGLITSAFIWAARAV